MNDRVIGINAYHAEFLKSKDDLFSRLLSRDRLVEMYSWGVPNDEAIDNLAGKLRFVSGEGFVHGLDKVIAPGRVSRGGGQSRR